MDEQLKRRIVSSLLALYNIASTYRPDDADYLANYPEIDESIDQELEKAQKLVEELGHPLTWKDDDSMIPAPGVLTTEQEVAYLENPSRCPVCESNSITSGHIEAEHTSAWADVSCNNCESTWQDVYQLVAIDEVVNNYDDDDEEDEDEEEEAL